ncbi:NADPH-dependent FMN reductase [Flavobacteriaceae bacterium M23B6Z8]
MKTILAFAGSNSSTSINLQLVRYTTSLIKEEQTVVLNMVNYPFPMYSSDLEKEKGFSNSLAELHHEIVAAKGLIISVNEYNGNLSPYFKNLIDWLSRFDKTFIKSQKIFLMSTSPGKRGAVSAKELAHKMLTMMGAEVTSTFSLPSFNENFDRAKGTITNKELDTLLEKELQTFLDQLT